MTEEVSRRRLAVYWMEKAVSALASAKLEMEHERYDFTVNRAYYAAFYAATAVLLLKGLKFSRHSGVRAAVHRDLARNGLIPSAMTEWYDKVFDSRQQGDYAELVTIEGEEAAGHVAGAERFVAAMKGLLST